MSNNRAISLGDKLRMNKPKKHIGLNTTLSFGKYKGKVAKKVKDPNYFKWLLENTDFTVHYLLTVSEQA